MILDPTARAHLYDRWKHMIARCTDPAHAGYSGYGLRGISVAPEWLTFTNYLGYVISLPGADLAKSLDRINNDGNYEPGNLRWVSARVQAQNRRPRNTNQTGLIGLSRRKRGSWLVDLVIDGARYRKESMSLDVALAYLLSIQHLIPMGGSHE